MTLIQFGYSYVVTLGEVCGIMLCKFNNLSSSIRAHILSNILLSMHMIQLFVFHILCFLPLSLLSLREVLNFESVITILVV